MHGLGMMTWHILGSLLGLLLIFLLVVAVVVVVKSIGGHNRPLLTGQENALDILKNRYARGEISKEEFERIRYDLK